MLSTTERPTPVSEPDCAQSQSFCAQKVRTDSYYTGRTLQAFERGPWIVLSEKDDLSGLGAEERVCVTRDELQALAAKYPVESDQAGGY